MTTKGERVQEAAQAMIGIEGVTEAYSVTGPYDLVVVVRIPDFERLAEIVPQPRPVIAGACLEQATHILNQIPAKNAVPKMLHSWKIPRPCAIC